MLYNSKGIILRKLALPSYSVLIDFCALMLQHLGDDAKIVSSILDGSHPFAEKLAAAKKPMIVVGTNALARGDGGALHAQLVQLSQKVKA